MNMPSTEKTVATVPVPKAAVIIDETGDQEQALTTQVTEVERKAMNFVIQTDDDYQDADLFGSQIKTQTKKVQDFFKPVKDQANQAHKAICARENAMLTPLKNAEKILKKTMADYHMEQERKRRAAEEAARRAAEAEAERMLKEAAAAEAAGNAAQAEAAMNEAIMMDEAKNSMVIPSQAPKAAKSSAKKDWVLKSVELEKIPHQDLLTIVQGIKPDYVNAVIIGMIRASKGTLSIPGIAYEETVQMTFRR